jgi:hypothetical protein
MKLVQIPKRKKADILRRVSGPAAIRVIEGFL